MGWEHAQAPGRIDALLDHHTAAHQRKAFDGGIIPGRNQVFPAGPVLGRRLGRLDKPEVQRVFVGSEDPAPAEVVAQLNTPDRRAWIVTGRLSGRSVGTARSSVVS